MIPADFEPIDLRLADYLAPGETAEQKAVRHAIRLLSRAVRLGHVCLPLRESVGEEAASALRASGVVGMPGDALPLILDRSGRLYFHRFRRLEETVARFLREAASSADVPVDRVLLDAGLTRLFDAREPAAPDRQREAAARSVLRPVSVVNGGPGTGKTTTVVKILALLLEQSGPVLPEIALAAPTGKAAARLKESVSGSGDRAVEIDPRIRERIPREAVTIHRLLGAIPGVGYRHGPGNPLPYDVVVVDEASMIALPLMAGLVAAMPKGGRLILLGDKDQLASVEEGAVFADLCGAGGPFAECVSVLTRNYRFGDDSPIALLAADVRDGKGEDAWKRLKDGKGGIAGWADLPASAEAVDAFLRPRVLSGFSPFLEAVREGEPETVLKAFERFRILSAHREGTYGVSGLNEAVERILSGEGWIRRPRTGQYAGRPILIRRNDAALRLSNGDTGVVLRDREDGTWKAFFPPVDDPGGGKPGTGFRTVLLPRLPEHETAWATTVHKSQGSEFDEVLLVLGPSESGLVTRELVYTGITRARKRVSVASVPEGFVKAVGCRVERHSGLGDLLAAIPGSPAGPARRSR